MSRDTPIGGTLQAVVTVNDHTLAQIATTLGDNVHRITRRDDQGHHDWVVELAGTADTLSDLARLIDRWQLSLALMGVDTVELTFRALASNPPQFAVTGDTQETLL